MQYLGEHHLWSLAGRLFVALSFAGAFVAAFFYGLQVFRSPAAREERPVHSLRTAGRWAFGLHSLGVLGTIGVLFAALFNHGLNSIMSGATVRSICRSNTSLPVFGKVKKEASCFG